MDPLLFAPRPPAQPHRIGVVLGDLGRVNIPALKYLIVYLNTLQNIFEYEILPKPPHSMLVSMLDGWMLMNRDVVRGRLREFHGQLTRHVAHLERCYLPYKFAVPTVPDHVVLLTMGRLENGFYTVGDDAVRAVALGHWQSELAPPSILEFFVTLLLRQSIALISPTFRSTGHIGTKGCLFDFTDDLGDARFKAMQGFVCHDCRRLLAEAPPPNLVEALVPILNTRSWLGSSADVNTPAGVVAKLGYDLFLTRGAQPSLKEKFFAILREDGFKELLKLASLILLALILYWFGLKGGS